MEFFNKLINGRSGYPPNVKRILDQYGNERITFLELRKYPIDPNLNKFLNVIVAMHGKAVPYEKLFHLSMFARTDAGTNLLIEKNYVFNMEVNPQEFPNTQRMEVPIHNHMPVIEMLERTKEEMGGNFFSYSSKDNNCQDWTLAFMNANGLNTAEFQNFIKQDVEQSMNGLVDLRKFLNTMTDTARWFDIIKQGGDTDLSDKNGLSNLDIDHILRDIPTYQGCYPKDKLPVNLKRGAWYVVNMQDAADGGGTHWVCFKYGYPVSYFDSFAVAPPIEIMKICKRQLIWNSKQIQDMDSTACGWFCCACILSDYHNGTHDTVTHFNRFINSFSDNTKVNDKILKKMMGYYSNLKPE